MKIFLIESLIRIDDLCPESVHVKELMLTKTEDALIWAFAKANGFVLVSKDSDFYQRSLLYGHPPKFVYLRVGNSPTSRIIRILRDPTRPLQNLTAVSRKVFWCFRSVLFTFYALCSVAR